MSRYEIVFDETAGPRPVPEPGETIAIGGAQWQVERVERSDAGPRIHLVSHGDEAEVEAHRRPPAPAAAPSSFETELVYTLNDLATRLSTLAAALNAYWGKGAA